MGTEKLLGLGLKYCVAPSKPYICIKDCIKKLAYRIRTKQYLLTENRQSEREYIPQIYVKLKNWHPPPASLNIENRITAFEKHLKETVMINNNKTQKYINLTPTQKNTLRELQHSDEFIILPTDKNLGPSIMNRDTYITQVFEEHLLTRSYTQLSEPTAKQRLSNTQQLLVNNFEAHRHELSQPEIEYFTRSFKTHHRTPIFYG